MSNIAVRNIERADAVHIAALEELGVSTVHEAQARSGLMNGNVRGSSTSMPTIDATSNPARSRQGLSAAFISGR